MSFKRLGSYPLGDPRLIASIGKTVTQAKTSDDTLANDDQLLFTNALIGHMYYVSCVWISSADSGTPDMKISFVGPTNAVGEFTQVGFNVASSPLGGTVGSMAQGTAERINAWSVLCHIVDTAGTIAFQWAQQTSDVAPLRVEQDSIMHVWDMGLF